MEWVDSFPPETAARAPKRLQQNPNIHPSCSVVRSKIGAWTELMANTRLVESTFDDFSYTAGDVTIIYSDIGKFVNLASHVRINPGNHPMERACQHHMLYRLEKYGFADQDDESFFDWRRSYRCVIGHDVWIGHSATIMPGVKIGTGSIVGAGAVVTKDVPPYNVVAGVPAKPIRERFPAHIASKLLEIAWWNWDRDTIKNRIKEFNDVEQFIKRYSRI